MVELFLQAVFGHVLGDFFFQPTAMALKKSKPGFRGFAWCTLHVVIYTFLVCVLVGSGNLSFWLAVGIPHWAIDRWSLGNRWLSLIGSRTVEQVLANPAGPDREFAAAFYAIVYVVVDNTTHLAMVWAAIRYLAV